MVDILSDLALISIGGQLVSILYATGDANDAKVCGWMMTIFFSSFVVFGTSAAIFAVI